MSVSPLAGAVWPSASRSPVAIARAMAPGARLPVPIYISVPAMMRTMLYRKPSPSTVSVTVSPLRVTCAR